jgi:glutathione S-transferase
MASCAAKGGLVPFEYISVEEAIRRGGLRMVVVGGVPSPWGEAAKGLLHIKGIEWTAVRLVYDSEALKEWAGQRSGPVAIYNDEPPRAGWKEILELAERLEPSPALLPADAADRHYLLQTAEEILGKDSLTWSRRLQLVHAGLQNAGGFPGRVAGYLAKKYGYTPELGAAASARVAGMLEKLADRLNAQRAVGSGYYIGNELTALDVYAATAMAMFRPLPEAQCRMDPTTRAAFELKDPAVEAALDPVLTEHRDRMYEKHLVLPLSL